MYLAWQIQSQSPLTYSLRDRLDDADLHAWFVPGIIVVACHPYCLVISHAACTYTHRRRYQHRRKDHQGECIGCMQGAPLDIAAFGFDTTGRRASRTRGSAASRLLGHRGIPSPPRLVGSNTADLGKSIVYAEQTPKLQRGCCRGKERSESPDGFILPLTLARSSSSISIHRTN